MTTGTPLGATRRLAGFLAGAQTRPVGDEALRTKARSCLLDAFGLALAARDDPTVRAYVDLAEPVAEPQGCRVWGGARVGLLAGISANAAAVHARFQDDCDMTSWAHPGSLIVPVAVGLGETADADLDSVCRAILYGYATLNWLGAEEVVGRAVVQRGFRASPTLGSVAAAATAAVMLRLSTEQASHAIGIAADCTGGLLEPVRAGASDWRVQNATAAYRGALAALLAARGIDGPPAALEGPAGLLRSFAGLSEPPAAWAEDPRLEAVLSVWAKPYPTLGDNIAVVATALSLRDALGDPRSLRSVRIHQNAHFASYPGTAFRGPFSKPAQGMASTAFATAATLLFGPLTYKTYTQRLTDPDIAALIEKTHVIPESGYGYLDASVEVETADGRRVSASAQDLPSALFFRDAATAVAAFRALLDETGHPQSFAAALPDLLHDGRGAVRRVIDAITSPATSMEALNG